MTKVNATVTALPARTRETVSEEKGPGKVITTGAVRALEMALEKAKNGEMAGVTIIGYTADGGWNTIHAGSILRTPAIGVAATQCLSAQFVKRIEEDVVIHPHKNRRT